MTDQKVQDTGPDKFRKHDKFKKKIKGMNRTVKEIWEMEVEDDETEAVTDGDDNTGF